MDTPTPGSTDPLGQPGARDYTLLAVGSLILQVVVLLQEDLGLWAVLPLLIGCAGLVARWSVGPPLVLVCQAAFFLFRARYRFPRGGEPALDLFGELALAGATLVYVAASYRLLSITRHVFPPETARWRTRPSGTAGLHWLDPDPPRNRAATLVKPVEVVGLLVLAILFVLVAWFTWGFLEENFRYSPLQLTRPFWQAVLVVWMVGMVVVVTGTVVGYLGWKQMRGEEAALYLQDQAWRQTRGEQARVQSWYVWGKLRAEKRRRGP